MVFSIIEQVGQDLLVLDGLMNISGTSLQEQDKQRAIITVCEKIFGKYLTDSYYSERNCRENCQFIINAMQGNEKYKCGHIASPKANGEENPWGLFYIQGKQGIYA